MKRLLVLLVVLAIGCLISGCVGSLFSAKNIQKGYVLKNSLDIYKFSYTEDTTGSIKVGDPETPGAKTVQEQSQVISTVRGGLITKTETIRYNVHPDLNLLKVGDYAEIEYEKDDNGYANPKFIRRSQTQIESWEVRGPRK